MNSCEGNWSSRIYWDKENQATPNQPYQPDGLLHICPHTGDQIHGEQFVTIGSLMTTHTLEGTFGQRDEGRFTINYSRDNRDGKTYTYTGTGRGIDDSTFAFIYGTVKASEEGSADVTGVWEAVRAHGRGRGPGWGEDGKGATSDTGGQPNP